MHTNIHKFAPYCQFVYMGQHHSYSWGHLRDESDVIHLYHLSMQSYVQEYQTPSQITL